MPFFSLLFSSFAFRLFIHFFVLSLFLHYPEAFSNKKVPFKFSFSVLFNNRMCSQEFFSVCLMSHIHPFFLNWSSLDPPLTVLTQGDPYLLSIPKGQRKVRTYPGANLFVLLLCHRSPPEEGDFPMEGREGEAPRREISWEKGYILSSSSFPRV